MSEAVEELENERCNELIQILRTLPQQTQYSTHSRSEIPAKLPSSRYSTSETTEELESE